MVISNVNYSNAEKELKSALHLHDVIVLSIAVVLTFRLSFVGMSVSTPIRKAGYPTEIFCNVASSTVKYLCSICQLILRNPVQRFCGHRYCRTCIEEANDGKNIAAVSTETVCPTCISEGTDNDMEEMGDMVPKIFPDNAIKREMSNLATVCCQEGCQWNGIFKDFVEHFEEHSVENRCPFGCSTMLEPGVDINDHLRSQLPEHFTIIFDRLRNIATKLGDSGASNVDRNSAFGQMADLERRISELRASDRPPSRTPTASASNSAATAVSGFTSSSAFEVLDKMQIVEGVITVLNREVEKMNNDMESVDRQRSQDRAKLDELERSMRSMERVLALKDATISELTIRLTTLEQTSYDGTLLWRVGDVSAKRQDATAARVTSVYSPAFFTSRTGYKLCLRVYLNGDGMGKGSHLSVFFVVMRGSYDALLRWPFRQKVTLMMLNQSGRDHVVDAFRPDPTSSSFKRPTSEMNIASGCPLFAPLTALDSSSGFVKDDQLFLKAIVDCSDIQ